MAKLTYRQRKGMTTTAFAIPSERKYPIEDIAHARDALSRVSGNGTPAEKAQVHRAVANRYPALAARSKAIKGNKKHNSPNQP